MPIVKMENLAAFGMIPMMLSPNSNLPLWEQVHRGYAHGGGWNDFSGFIVIKTDDDKYHLRYPGDPMYDEIGRIRIGDQMLVIFPYSWLLWLRMDAAGEMTEHKIARID